MTGLGISNHEATLDLFISISYARFIQTGGYEAVTQHNIVNNM